jgi:heme/copper-type cytochrome/quinol oxidase subunit 3
MYLIAFAGREQKKSFASAEGRRRSLTEVVGLYWHFMDGLWVFLFLLLFLWR